MQSEDLPVAVFYQKKIQRFVIYLPCTTVNTLKPPILGQASGGKIEIHEMEEVFWYKITKV